ncbi:hypothetical protein AGMMS50256_34410 [Betaproteobacteria bacterium]|nr:hypothetical protein AGMMS50256_34410 [Betaproteobacteria bacterium]
MAPHGIYRCKGEDSWCAVAVDSDQAWRALVALMEQPALADVPDYATPRDRVANRVALDEIVTAWTKGREVGEVAAALRQAGIPAAHVANARYLIENDAQLAARAYWQRVDHPELGRSLYASPPYRVDGERIELVRPPLLGEHTRKVLSGLLGLKSDELDNFEASGVFK